MLQNLDTVTAFAVVMLLLSLLITVMVQCVIAFGRLRGRHLIWGVRTLLEQFDPSLKPHARELARKILTHPAISHNGHETSAISVNELLAILDDLRRPESKLSDKTKEALQITMVHLQYSLPWTSDTNPLPAAAQEARSKFDTWYDAIMARTTERFVAETRRWTVVCAIVLAGLGTIDSIAILKQLSGNSEVRASVLRMADGTERLAGDMNKRLVESDSYIADTFKACRVILKDNTAIVTALDKAPRDLRDRSEAQRWIRESIPVPEDQRKALETFDNKYFERAGSEIRELVKTTLEIRGDLRSTQLTVIRPLWQSLPHNPNWGLTLIGIILTAMLLSLGAPFWYNVLREVSNLRPMLAGKVDAANSDRVTSMLANSPDNKTPG